MSIQQKIFDSVNRSRLVERYTELLMKAELASYPVDAKRLESEAEAIYGLLQY